MKLLFLTIFIFFGNLNLFAEEIELFRINLDQQDEDIIYKANINDECHFISDQSIIFIRKNRSKNHILDNLYFAVDKYYIEKDVAIFSVNAAKNIKFILELSKSPKTGNCLLETFIDNDEGKYGFKSLELHLTDRLGAYNLSYAKIVSDNKEIVPEKVLYPWDLQGYLPFYEGHLGLAINTHTNIFHKNSRKFNKTNPAIEPVPLMLFRFGPFFLSKDGIGMLLAPFKYFTLLGTFLLEGEPHKNNEINKRSQSIYYGFLAKIDMLEIQYYREMRGFHYGHVWKFSLAPEFDITRRLSFGPRLYFQRWDSDYVNYHFGLKETERFSKGIPYETDRTYNYGISLNTVYKNKRFQYILTTELKRYGNQVTNSPLVRTDQEFRFIAGILYKLF